MNHFLWHGAHSQLGGRNVCHITNNSGGFASINSTLVYLIVENAELNDAL